MSCAQRFGTTAQGRQMTGQGRSVPARVEWLANGKIARGGLV